VCIHRVLAEFAETGGIVVFAPWTRHIAPDLVGYTSLRKVIDGMRVFAERSIGEHKKSHSTDFSR